MIVYVWVSGAPYFVVVKCMIRKHHNRIAKHLRSLKPYTARHTKPIRKIAEFLGKYIRMQIER